MWELWLDVMEENLVHGWTIPQWAGLPASERQEQKNRSETTMPSHLSSESIDSQQVN